MKDVCAVIVVWWFAFSTILTHGLAKFIIALLVAAPLVIIACTITAAFRLRRGTNGGRQRQ